MFKLPSFDDDDDLNAEELPRKVPSHAANIYPPTTAESDRPLPVPPPSAVADVNASFRSRTILVNPLQKGNPVLTHILNNPYEYVKDIVPDFVVGQGAGVLFLSIRYHRLHPDYIYERMKALGMNSYKLKILLVFVDVEDKQQAVRELSKLCILQNYTMMLAWTPEEAGRIIEVYKMYENKSADGLKEKVGGDHLSQLTDCLTSIKGINKTDVMTLVSTFGTFKNIVEAKEEDLIQLPGFGPQKVARMREAFTQPFLAK